MSSTWACFFPSCGSFIKQRYRSLIALAVCPGRNTDLYGCSCPPVFGLLLLLLLLLPVSSQCLQLECIWATESRQALCTRQTNVVTNSVSHPQLRQKVTTNSISRIKHRHFCKHDFFSPHSLCQYTPLSLSYVIFASLHLCKPPVAAVLWAIFLPVVWSRSG